MPTHVGLLKGFALLAGKAGCAATYGAAVRQNVALRNRLSASSCLLLGQTHDASDTLQKKEFRTHSARHFSSREAESTDMLIDTLEVMRGFEQAGLKREEADVLTRHVTKLILSTSNQFSQKFASNTYLEKLSGQLGSDMISFKNEILKTQELQLGTLQKEIEASKNELAKLRTEIRYEMDKMISSQRLDLNLEKGRLRDELQATSHDVQTIETQLHKEINIIRTGIEANKNEIIKYSIGTLMSVGAVGLGLLRLMT